MEIIVSARHSQLAQSMKEEAYACVEKIAEFHGKLTKAEVVMDTVKDRNLVEIVMHGKGINVTTKGEGENLYVALHEAGDHMDRQLKRISDKRKDHSGKHLGEIEAEREAAYMETVDEF